MKPCLDSVLGCSLPVAQQLLPTLEAMLRHAVLLNASDVVSSVADLYTFYLRQLHHHNHMLINERDGTAHTHTSPPAVSHINDDSPRLRPMSDFLVLAIEQSCDHSLHSLLGVDAFKQAINRTSSGWSWPINVDSPRVYGPSCGRTPLEAACYQLAPSSSSFRPSHSHSYSYKKEEEREEQFHLTVLRAVLRAGADPFARLTHRATTTTSSTSSSSNSRTDHTAVSSEPLQVGSFSPSTLRLPCPDNIFALAAYLGSTPALRVLLLAYPNVKCLPVSCDSSLTDAGDDGRPLHPDLSDVPDHHHRFGRHSAAQSLGTRTRTAGRGGGGERGGMGFLMGSARFVSNPLCYAIARGHGGCLQYLMDHTPFSALANTPLTMMTPSRQRQQQRHLLLHELTPLAMAAAWSPFEPFLVVTHSNPILTPL